MEEADQRRDYLHCTTERIQFVLERMLDENMVVDFPEKGRTEYVRYNMAEGRKLSSTGG